MPNFLVALLYISLFLSFYNGFLLGQLALMARRKALKITMNTMYGKMEHPYELPSDEKEWRKLLRPPGKF